MLKSPVKVVGIIVVCFFIIFLGFLSVLGENDRTKTAVKSYFSEIKEKKYESLRKYYTASANSKCVNVEELKKFHFLLEVALLKYFNIEDEADFTPNIKRSNLWLPVIDKPYINLDVAFISAANQGLLSKLDQPKFLKDFITLKRENDSWKIDSVNIDNSEIKNLYHEMKSSIQFENYVTINENKMIINPTEIDLKDMNYIEKKVIVHDLETAIEKIKSIK